MRSKNLSLVSFVAMSFLITSCNRNSNESNSSDSGKVVETISIETGDSVKKQVPGSIFWYTQAEIDNYYSAPDWFPEDHTPMPDLVNPGTEMQ